ncbi:MAG: sensor histidine kinase, partial [Helicobacteraceae bacterium]|nr:sensor histidine kinase [Helicobacteraceae bacterium]
HRVKNNMQFITSLYALKLGDNVDVQDKLQDVERKVLAMSQVHQMLYTQKNLNYIQADDYFETIIKNIQESFNQENIKFIYDIQINLNIEEAIYCGLILNELVTNAMKYAFAQNKGEIRIALSEDKDCKYLKVQDNGMGIQKDSKSGFGQMLIETLATKQLGGKISIDSTNGTTTEISFQKI